MSEFEDKLRRLRQQTTTQVQEEKCLKAQELAEETWLIEQSHREAKILSDLANRMFTPIMKSVNKHYLGGRGKVIQSDPPSQKDREAFRFEATVILIWDVSESSWRPTTHEGFIICLGVNKDREVKVSAGGEGTHSILKAGSIEEDKWEPLVGEFILKSIDSGETHFSFLTGDYW